jgi:hypothetical protein
LLCLQLCVPSGLSINFPPCGMEITCTLWGKSHVPLALCLEYSAPPGNKPPKSPDNSWMLSTVPAMALVRFLQQFLALELALAHNGWATKNQAFHCLSSWYGFNFLAHLCQSPSIFIVTSHGYLSLNTVIECYKTKLRLILDFLSPWLVQS